MLVVGDSVSALFRHAVEAVLGSADRKLHRLRGINQQSTICGSRVAIDMIRSDHLGNGSWVSKLQHYDVIVMNTGAHVLSSKRHAKAVRWAAEAAVHYSLPNATLVWRDTPAGHDSPLCNVSRSFAPMEMLHEAEHRLQASTGPLTSKFEWRLVASNNAVSRSVFEGSPALRRRFVWLPAYAVTMVRWDRHLAWESHLPYIDCLHHCFPGPVDTWVHLLYHLLGSSLL